MASYAAADEASAGAGLPVWPVPTDAATGLHVHPLSPCACDALGRQVDTGQLTKLPFHAMDTPKANQHYVPKLLLRRFSHRGDGKTVGVFTPKTGLFFPRAPIRSQASRPYFYGRDGVWEERLSELEGMMAATLRDAADDKAPSGDPDALRKEIIFHLALLTLRTEGRILAHQELTTEFTNAIFEKNGLAAPDSKQPMTQREHIDLAMKHVISAVERSSDLSVGIIRNLTSTPFITCDDPVITYNQLLEHHKVAAGISGLGQAGVQRFWPIDPQTLVMAYDNRFYRLKSKRDTRLIYCTPRDVDQINLLSILHCRKVVFFNEGASEMYLKKLASKALATTPPGRAVVRPYYKVEELEEGDIFSTSRPPATEDEKDVMFRGFITSARIKLALSFVSFTWDFRQYCPARIPGELRPAVLEIDMRESAANPPQPFQIGLHQSTEDTTSPTRTAASASAARPASSRSPI